MQEESKNPDVSVIIPAYNEDKTIGDVVRRLKKIDGSLRNMEIVVVDDGSTDNTQREVAAFPFVKYVRHEKNLGKGAAIRIGTKFSAGKVIVILDADLEYAPEDVLSLVEPILAGRADIVYGSRFTRRPSGMSSSHFVGNKVLSLAARILYDVRVTDVMTGQKAFSRMVFGSLDLRENGFLFEVEATSKALQNGWRFAEVPVSYSFRRSGVSKLVYSDGVKSLLRLIADRCRGVGVSNNHSNSKEKT